MMRDDEKVEALSAICPGVTVETGLCDGVERILEISFAGLGYDEITRDETFYEIIATLPAVRVLDFQYSPVADSCLKIVSGLKSLENLSIIDCGNITDEGMSYVAHMKSLKVIGLSFTEIGNRGVRWLRALKNLAVVYFDDVRHADSSVLEVFADLANLSELYLSGMNFGQSVAAGLLSLKRVKRLRLSRCEGIDDSFVEVISQLSHLEHLEIKGTEITDSGVDRLKDALRGCVIVF